MDIGDIMTDWSQRIPYRSYEPQPDVRPSDGRPWLASYAETDNPDDMPICGEKECSHSPEHITLKRDKELNPGYYGQDD